MQETEVLAVGNMEPPEESRPVVGGETRAKVRAPESSDSGRRDGCLGEADGREARRRTDTAADLPHTQWHMDAREGIT